MILMITLEFLGPTGPKLASLDKLFTLLTIFQKLSTDANRKPDGMVHYIHRYLCLVECKTRSGEPCAFPFYYNGTDHYECITHDNDGTPWCNVITSDGENGRADCMSDCPGKFVLTIQFNDDDDKPLFS